MEDFLAWIQNGWIFLAAIIGGVTLVWNFIHKTLKEIKEGVSSPFTELEKKIDELKARIEKSNEHDHLVQRALLTMQRNSLLRSCEEFIAKGYANVNEKDTISEQYTSYSELGGDSFVTEMVAKVMTLPVSKPKKLQKKIGDLKDEDDD